MFSYLDSPSALRGQEAISPAATVLDRVALLGNTTEPLLAGPVRLFLPVEVVTVGPRCSVFRAIPECHTHSCLGVCTYRVLTTR